MYDKKELRELMIKEEINGKIKYVDIFDQ